MNADHKGRISVKKRAGIFFLYSATLLLPFVVFHWTLPFFSDHIIGNDYTMFSPPQQMELQYSIKHGTWPLFSPGFAGGRPAAALTLGQLFHPISHIAAAIPGYWDGDALNITTLLRLLSLGLAQLALLVLLRKLSLRTDLAFIISFITVYNMRMLDTFRFGASLESYTGHIFLFTALALYYLKPTKLTGPIAIIFSTFWLVVGGHPQMMYFGMLTVGITIFLIPFALPAISSDALRLRGVNRRQEILKFYGAASLLITAGVGLAAAYILPLYFDFVAETAARAGNAYQFSLLNCDTWGGALNSFFKPLHASVTGNFGSSSIIAIIPLVPFSLILRKRLPKVTYAIWGVLALIFVISLGDATPIHYWFWRLFPLANAFRVPGRITMMMPVLILMLFAIIWSNDGQSRSIQLKNFAIPTTTVFFFATLALFVIYEFLLKDIASAPGFPLPKRFRHDFPDWMFSFIFWSGTAVLLLASLRSIAWRGQILVGVLLAAAVTVQTSVQLKYGTWIRRTVASPTMAIMDKQKEHRLDFRGHPGNRMQSDLIDKRMTRSFLETDIAKFYRKFQTVDSQNAAFNALAKTRRADTIILEGFGKSIDAKNQNGIEDIITLTSATFNKLIFEVKNNAPGFLSLTMLDDKHRWKAQADAKDTTVYRANAGEQAIYLLPGKHTVEFKFTSPATTAGMAVSLATLLLIGGFFCKRIFNGRAFLIGIAISTLACVGLFWLFRSSLYGGDNLKTKYFWTSSQLPDANNLAFGRPTKMSSLASNQRPYSTYAGRGVDGNTKARGFKTRPQKKHPWWQVDLGKQISIGEIVIHDSHAKSCSFHLPISVLLSDDGVHFKKVKDLNDRGKTTPWRVKMSGLKGRFIRLQSSSKHAALSFNEVEVYDFKEVKAAANDLPIKTLL